MKVKLIRQFKNHPAGSEIDVSKRIYSYLLGLKVIENPKPVPRLEPKRKSKKEPEKKNEE